MIQYLNDYISGEKFANISDFIFGDEICEIYDRENKIIDNIINSEKENVIIYCRSNYNPLLVNFVTHNNIKKKITLINQNSDFNLNYVIPIVHRHYSQNVNIRSEKIISIPIGLENKYNFPDIRKIDKMKSKLQERKYLINLCYINHNVSTNVSKRSGIYELFSNDVNFTIERGQNGKDFDNYLEKVYNHKFVICPEGNGLDTHRTWECLYLGTIPVEKRNINNSFYEGKLPICFVDDWSELTSDFLESEYERIKNTHWNLEMLTFTFWKNKILKNG